MNKKTCPECFGLKGIFSYGEMQTFPRDTCLGYGFICEEPNQPEKKTMNYSTAVMLINPAIIAVKGQYEENGNTEIFKTTDQSLKVGDLVVVESTTRWKMTVFKITEIDVDVDFDSSKHCGWVVQKIDSASHDNLKKMEEQAIELIKKGELRKRREDIRKNTLDAVVAGEIDNLEIARLGAPAIENKTT